VAVGKRILKLYTYVCRISLFLLMKRPQWLVSALLFRERYMSSLAEESLDYGTHGLVTACRRRNSYSTGQTTWTDSNLMRGRIRKLKLEN
jgi:hypothetical protein